MLLPYINLIKETNEVWNYCPYLMFCMIFKEKYFSIEILLTDWISLPGCLYFFRYCVICVLQLFIVIIYVPGCDVINFEINQNFLIKPFFYITKNSGQKYRYFCTNQLTWKRSKYPFCFIILLNSLYCYLLFLSNFFCSVQKTYDFRDFR